MPDLEQMMETALKGAAVGVGVYGSTFIGDTIEDNTGIGNLGVAGGMATVGFASAFLSDYAGQQISSFDRRVGNWSNMFLEHSGYGLMAAGLAEGVDVAMNGSITANTVSVDRSQASSGGNTQTGQNPTGQRNPAFSMDTG